jgi:hypothetical protein
VISQGREVTREIVGIDRSEQGIVGVVMVALAPLKRLPALLDMRGRQLETVAGNVTGVAGSAVPLDIGKLVEEETCAEERVPSQRQPFRGGFDSPVRRRPPGGSLVVERAVHAARGGEPQCPRQSNDE